jgi:hypothetical protein
MHLQGWQTESSVRKWAPGGGSGPVAQVEADQPKQRIALGMVGSGMYCKWFIPHISHVPLGIFHCLI